jgi:hypothetical protein
MTNHDLQRDAKVLRDALKWALTYRRIEVSGRNLWRDRDGVIAEPPLQVATVLAVVESEVELECEYAG